MAVYTHLNKTIVDPFLQQFGWESATEIKATDSGIENTNYFVTAVNHLGNLTHLVLTLFETMKAADLPYFIALTSHLSKLEIPVPKPYADLNRKTLHFLHDKPALLVPCFKGKHPLQPTVKQCQTIAHTLAKIHASSEQFSLRRKNDRGAQWRQQACETLKPYMPPDQHALLDQQIQHWQIHQNDIQALPHGITHGDLFRDNALFLQDRLTGIIDFYNACHDAFIYDLAVLINDWCLDHDGALDARRYQTTLQAYRHIRPFTEEEESMWPFMLRYAAVRFWISRLLSWHLNDDASVAQKDPNEMHQLLLKRL